MLNFTFRTFALVALLGAGLSAQITYMYDVSSPGVLEAMNLDSAAFPDGGPSLDPLLPGPLPNAGLLPPAAFPAGAQAADDVARTVYTTDGVMIAVDHTPNSLYYGGPVPPLPPPVAPILPAGFGPVISGMAMDSAGGILWVCDPFGLCVPLAPFAPFPALAGPVAIPGLVGPPVVGLGYESSTGPLWAVDAGGAVYNFTVGGAPVGPQPVVVVPSVIGFLFNGLTVNTSNGPGAFAPPGCSMETGSQHVVITDGAFLYDAVPGIAPPKPLVGASLTGLGVVGLAYASECQVLPGFAGCASAAAPFATAGTAISNHVGASAFTALELKGAPPLTSVVFAADLCPIPGGAFVPASGETLWVSPFSPGFVMAGAITDAAGNAAIPLSFVPLPAGVEFVFQWGIADPLAPLGVCLSDAALVKTGLR
ncbi:MAG: hypothetical protein R3F20_07885 [Planctomycetota bacterium]